MEFYPFIIEPYNPYVKAKPKTLAQLLEEEQFIYRIIMENSFRPEESHHPTVAAGSPPFISQATSSQVSLSAPIALAATTIGGAGFTASWSSVTNALSYRLDVSVSASFSNFVGVYNNLNVGNVTGSAVANLSSSLQYFYRVRAANASTTSLNSNVMSASTTASWPFGTDGALVINGTTLTLAPSTKDYSSVSIINGGILNISGSGSDVGQWMIIGCTGTFTLDSASKVIYDGVNLGKVTSSVTAVAPDGQVLSKTYVIGAGGAGGNDPLDGISFGGQQSSGNGGGGAAHSVSPTPRSGSDATPTRGGRGNDALVLGGSGSRVLSGTGQKGQDDAFDGPEGTAGAGGGGGFVGRSAGNIYIKVGPTGSMMPTFTLAYLPFKMSGSRGGAGGAGGFGQDGQQGWGGCGGGGGAGGDGGNLLIVYRNGASIGQLASAAENGGGDGGVGGVGGAGIANQVAQNGNDGGTGESGDDGFSQAGQY